MDHNKLGLQFYQKKKEKKKLLTTKQIYKPKVSWDLKP